MNPTILICDDNIAVHETLSLYLKEAHFHSISVYNGESVLEVIQRQSIDLIILDLMLPDKSGIEILKEIRHFMDIPIICLSAKTSEFDRILGLELGADDYITKPFFPREVVIKLQKLLKRTSPAVSLHKQICFSNLVIDLNSFTALLGKEKLDLTPKELQMLALFAQNHGMVLTRERILNAVWGHDFFSDSRVVDNHVKNIRQKLPVTSTFEIKSIYGIGYKLELTE